MNRDIVYVNVDQLKHIEDFGRKRVDWLREKILTEGEWTVPLKVEKDHFLVMDGQHRMEALRYAVNGRDQNGGRLKFGSNLNLNEEEITVLLLTDRTKVRRIFNKVNKYARKTSTGDDIIVNDDNYVAGITREIIRSFKGDRIIKLDNNTIHQKEVLSLIHI